MIDVFPPRVGNRPILAQFSQMYSPIYCRSTDFVAIIFESCRKNSQGTFDQATVAPMRRCLSAQNLIETPFWQPRSQSNMLLITLQLYRQVAQVPTLLQRIQRKPCLLD